MKIRSGYSFKVAVGHLDEVISRLKEIGWKAAPISDYNSTFGFNRFTKAAKAAGLKPIYGVQLPVCTNGGDKKPMVDVWTFFAKNSLRPLHDLIGLATAGDGLHYKDALKVKDIIKISGNAIQLDALAKLVTGKDFYIGLSPAMPKGLFNEARRRGYKFMACGDNVYPRVEDSEFYRVTLGKRSATQTYPQHILSDKEWLAACAFIADNPSLKAAIKNRDAAMSACNVTMKRAALLVPEKPKTLRQMCLEGAKRTNTNLKDPVYRERLERELKLIAEKNFEDYFFVIADLINWAKERMIVGPARGSSCGSLVCYLLNITTIDPIPYGLIFERFIDTNRKDLPDIDIDFSDERRHLVFEYAEQKYGKDRVARLGTVGMFKPRSALNQAGISLQIPKWQVSAVADGIIERSGGDSRALQVLEDTLKDTEAGRKMLAEYPEVMIAGRMEGHPNNAGQHAAGIVITNEPVTEYVAVDRRNKSAMLDKKDAEDLNLLKIDALGLTQLSIFERTLQLIGKPDKNGWLETLPLDDKKAFDVLNKGHFAGIFQFTGGALQSLTKQIKVSHVEDMISITALARPGPMATGGANSWVKRRTGREKIEEVHPMLTELTKSTYGIVVYQETVMNIAREMGKFTWAEVTDVRQAMSRRLGNEFFERYRIKFLSGAAENGIEEKTAEQIWKNINTMGSWAFNRSHAVAYGLVSYYCAYLKAHFPLEFAAATLDAEADPARQIMLLRELKSEGIDYVAVDAEHSTDRWVPVKKGKKKMLVGPLTAIKGIGPATVMEILEARKNKKPIRATLLKKLEEARTEIDTVYPIADAIKTLHPDLQAINIVSEPTPIIKVQSGAMHEVMIFAVVKKIAPKDENEPIAVQRRLERRKANGQDDGWDGNYRGPTASLNLFFQDDTDEIFAKVMRKDYERIGRSIVERGRPGKALYAIKGTVPPDFRMIRITHVRYLGDLEEFNMNKSGSGTSRGTYLPAGEQSAG